MRTSSRAGNAAAMMWLMHAPPLSVAEARRAVADALSPLEEQQVPVAQALDRALAEDVLAEADVPAFANSAMDGFAVPAGDRGRRLRIVGEAAAGRPSTIVLGVGDAVRISTGAALPAGADAVVPSERAREGVDEVELEIEARPGLNVRATGEDMRAGDPVLVRGRSLGPAELGVAVAAGRSFLRCARRPVVTIVSSGDELREAGATLAPGQIHNSNAITLEALTRRAGAEPQVAGRIPDSLAATEAALGRALEQGDVLVVSGGVSVGRHDHVKPALAALGVDRCFWRVALRPGGPIWFGTRESKLVFGLPGNPVSAMVTFLLFVAPALAELQGLPSPRRRRSATLTRALPRLAERDHAVRVSLREDDGRLVAIPTGPQGSHQLTSMLAADALLLVGPGEGELAAGARVSVEVI